MVKMNGCAAIDSARPFRFLADKAAVAADFHLENDACYHGKRRIASTASVATLAKTGVVRPGFPCRIASKSGEYPHRSLPFWQAMHGGTHSCVLQNFSLADLLQNLVRKHTKPFNNFKEIGYAPAALKSTKHYRALNAFPPDAIRNIGGHISMQEFLLFF